MTASSWVDWKWRSEWRCTSGATPAFFRVQANALVIALGCGGVAPLGPVVKDVGTLVED
jgi:hypothetical protein